MSKINEHVNFSNQKIHSYDQMRKFIVKWGSKKFESKNNSTCQLNNIHNSLLMSAVDTPEKYLSNFDRKQDMRKVCTSSIN